MLCPGSLARDEEKWRSAPPLTALLRHMVTQKIAFRRPGINQVPCSTTGMNTGFHMSGFPTARCRWPRRRCQSSRTHGCRIVLADGRELIDGIASWWSVCHGYNHPHILECVARQLETMPHVMFGGLVHEPALRLASRLTAMAPAGLTRVFFSDSGSVAVEVALKIALQYWRNLGKTGKDRFLCFTNGYHGDTFGAMSVSDPAKSMHKALKGALVPQRVVDIPSGAADFAELDAMLARVSHELAAMIIEPLVQGAGGMRFHRAEILADLSLPGEEAWHALHRR